MTPADPLGRVGTTVADRYVLTSFLGAGAMGCVYEAQHSWTGRRVALKLMRATEEVSQAAIERFVREARVAANLGHPGIVDVLDAGEDADGSLFIAFEKLEGESLQARLRAVKTLPIEDAIRVTLEVLDALDAAHGHGIVHRDVKPDNVYVARDHRGVERVKVLDFGVSKVTPLGRSHLDARTLTQKGTPLGSPAFMSPEHWNDAPHVDGRADLWSVGVMLYLMVTGTFPFRGANAGQVLVAIMTLPPAPFPASVPASLRAIIERSLEKAREARFQTAAEMRLALEACLAGLSDPAGEAHTAITATEPMAVMPPSVVAPVPPARLARRGSTGRTAGLAALAVALFGVVAFAVARTVTTSHPPTPTAEPIAPIPRADAAPVVVARSTTDASAPATNAPAVTVERELPRAPSPRRRAARSHRGAGSTATQTPASGLVQGLGGL